jgi:hypothetical protein
MVGFWRSLEAKEKGNDGIGAGQSFPNLQSTHFTWPQEMLAREDFQDILEKDDHVTKKAKSLDSYRFVEPFWKLLNPEDRIEKNDSYRSFFQGF